MGERRAGLALLDIAGILATGSTATLRERGPDTYNEEIDYATDGNGSGADGSARGVRRQLRLRREYRLLHLAGCPRNPLGELHACPIDGSG
jgi:hypothetical protein